MTSCFYKTSEVIGSSYLKIPIRSSAAVNIKSDGKYCFLRSILPHFHPITISQNGHPSKVSKNTQYFNELNVDGFNFTNVFKSTDVHGLEKLYNLSVIFSDLLFYEESKNWKQKLVPIQMCENKSQNLLT